MSGFIQYAKLWFVSLWSLNNPKLDWFTEHSHQILQTAMPESATPNKHLPQCLPATILKDRSKAALGHPCVDWGRFGSS